MTLDEKKELVDKYRDACVVAIETVIDAFLALVGDMVNEKLELVNPPDDTKLLEEAKKTIEDIRKYEVLRHKVIEKAELTELDISYIGVCLNFNKIRVSNMITNLEKTKEILDVLSVAFLPEKKS